tara:strand:+ start:1306 stop:2958 length:1653 start_codon:yes stop_codon:yes gene_type:complete
MEKELLRVIPLGGLGNIGRNMMVFEFNEDIIVVDVGIMFPEEDMLGVDLVLPDFSYLLQNKEKIRGIFLTHGHEDHIGALPYLLKQINVPVFSTKLTDGLVRVKCREHKIDTNNLNVVEPGDNIESGAFEVEFFSVAHSIPDACGLIIRTPLGNIVHTGDFKLDYTPVMNQFTDLTRLGQIGAEGCLLLLADSTYAEIEGFTPSEQKVGDSLRHLTAAAEGRVIVATFASLIARIQQVIDAAVLDNRKVFITGRSMINNVAMARELGYLEVPANTIVGVEEMRKLEPDKLTVLTTGSQGEPTSALTRMANGEHKHLNIMEGDTIILSANAIPGNEKSVYNNVDNLFRRGAMVLYNRVSDVHVRGHAGQEELKLVQSLLKPDYFVPIHGEYRMLVTHARLAESVGLPEGNAFVLTDGDVLSIDSEDAYLDGNVDARYVYIDGKGVGDFDETVLRERADLSTDGVLVVIVTIDEETGDLVGQVEVVSHGFIDLNEHDVLHDRVAEITEALLSEISAKKDYKKLSRQIQDSTAKFLYDETRRRPTVMPLIIDV